MHAKPALVLPFIIVLFFFSSTGYVFAQKTLTSGPYQIEIGWLNARPISGQMNAITVNISLTNNPSTPVSNDDINLTLTISYGGQNQVLSLQPAGENSPGHFIAPILPTVPGLYTVSFVGSIGSTDDVDGDVQLDRVQDGGGAPFPPVNSGSPGRFPWGEATGISALVISLAALGVGLWNLRRK